MHSIAIINQKGGVGKTTTAVNLSAALAGQGYRVGLIDMDPQAHASLHLGVGLEQGGPSVYDLLTGDAQLADVWRTVNDNLRVAPSHLDLAAAEVELAGVVGRELILRDKLRDANIKDPSPETFAREAGEDEFDFVFIDCPPSLGILTINALSAVNDVFLPLQPHFLALHGLSKLLQTVNLVAQRLNDRLRLAGVIFCLFDSATKLAAEVTSDVEAYFRDTRGRQGVWQDARVFASRIRRNIRLAESPSFGQSIFQYAPHSAGAEDYRSLAAEVVTLYVGQQESNSYERRTAA